MGRQSMPVRHNSRNWLRRSLYGLLIVFLAVLIAAVCIFSVVNANGLQTAVDRRTKAYVSDVTFQMAQNIDAQLATMSLTLKGRGKNALLKGSYPSYNEGVIGLTGHCLSFYARTGKL